jgi:hypothetical protein
LPREQRLVPLIEGRTNGEETVVVRATNDVRVMTVA